MANEKQHTGRITNTTSAEAQLVFGREADVGRTPYLEPAQQDLLIAALTSQASQKQVESIHHDDTSYSSIQSTNIVPKTEAMESSTMFQSPIVDDLNGDFTPDLYDLDGENSFDFDNADLGGEMIGALPDTGASGSANSDYHEKRKTLDEDYSLEEGDAKRQELQEGERGAKKPGRKPLTSEPTTKRKAQNRAAQRAFRERKEKHLKDLETQVTEMTKSQEADKHENGLLRAQVDRLQVELKEYRKRLSLNSGSVSRSPPLSASTATQHKNPAQFQFDFPKFGSLPSNPLSNSAAGFGIANNSNTTPPATQSPKSGSFSTQTAQSSRHNSQGRSLSPTTTQNQFSKAGSPSQLNSFDTTLSNFAPYSTNDNMHGFASTLPQMGKPSVDPFGDLFSPSLLKSVGQNGGSDGTYFTAPQQQTGHTATGPSNGGDSTAGIPDHRVFRFNSSSVASDSASPSASSTSQWNNGTNSSSCDTSPEPLVESPAIKEKPSDNFSSDKSNTPNQTGAFTQFTGSGNQAIAQGFSFGSFGTVGVDNFNVPQMDSFDPVLFGDYRDTNDNIVGGGDFTGGFFDESMNSAPLDLGSPSNLFGILNDLPANNTQAPLDAPTPSRNLMAEIDKARDGGDEDYGLPTTQVQEKTDSSGKLISCTKIWSQLQSNPDFQDGKFDLDGLCSELRTKARCSESGLMVEKSRVDAALKKLSQQKESTPPSYMMFEQESWDNVFQKMNAGQKQ